MNHRLQRFNHVRAHTLRLIQGLSAEDCMVQSMPDASPVKWHLAHTTWFFETFLLEPHEMAFKPFDPAYRVLFNSYYVGVGERHPRPARGVLSRPALSEVLAYRDAVDARMNALLTAATGSAQPQDESQDESLWGLLELGIQHEQQHQELILTDLLHHFSCNPTKPAYHSVASAPSESEPLADPLQFQAFTAGFADIGHGGDGFAFDNELPRHRVWLNAYALATRPVNQAEYLAFVRDGGYVRPELWLSDGWDLREREGWVCPLYWQAPADDHAGQAWRVFGLHGLQQLDALAPVCHLSYYEADAYARWAGARLPTEAEWEHAANQSNQSTAAGTPSQVWQWTQSAYLPYPGFAPASGAVGEYNGKFMVNQMVLRGGSSATPAGHARSSYRNFFPAAARWQFSGIRLAKNS